jgi:hypothetical protein
VAPIVGGLLGGVIHRVLFEKEPEPPISGDLTKPSAAL